MLRPCEVSPDSAGAAGPGALASPYEASLPLAPASSEPRSAEGEVGTPQPQPNDGENAYKLHRRFDRMGRLVGDALGHGPLRWKTAGSGLQYADKSALHAGITSGCDAQKKLYCPDQPVSRGQMAAFLHLAFGP